MRSDDYLFLWTTELGELKLLLQLKHVCLNITFKILNQLKKTLIHYIFSYVQVDEYLLRKYEF